MPGALALEAQAFAIDPSPKRLTIPGSPSSGSVSSAPVQDSGSAANLPHLVGPAATQPQTKDKASSDSKRPEGALPLEKPHEMVDEPATNGLNSPPPLTWQPSPAATGSVRVKNDGRQARVRAESADIRKVSLSTLNGQGSAVRGDAKATRTQAVPAVTAALPTVSGLSAYPGQQVSGLWTLPSTQPTFSAYGSDSESRPLRLEAQIEHDPSAAGQGSGLIWSGNSDLSNSGCHPTTRCWLQTPAVTAGKLKDGWLIRWRVRTTTSTAIAGPWSEWQAGRVDASKPVVSELSAYPGQQTSGLWTLPSTQPTFSA
ncbi:hypothetical protein, partial [Streptosporangium vulgare]